MDFLIDLQQWIRASVADELAGFETSRSLAFLIGMLPLGIAFGAVHALTPGHGKTVLASYLVGSRLGMVQGAGVAGALSATHVASAVLLALVGAPLLSRTIAGAGRSDLIEDVSRGLIALIGVWLLVRALRGERHPRGEGMAVAVAAGLVPCPLTLFAMIYALSHGVPEAGLVFALAMLIGITLTLAGVAVATALARDRMALLVARHGTSLARTSRILDATAGILLIAVGAAQFV
ncbi:MAG TPA: ABC transporter permease [Bauldia sp.]|nr:ABC transporter permease [Bauldia sp.]